VLFDSLVEVKVLDLTDSPLTYSFVVVDVDRLIAAIVVIIE